MNSKKTTNTKKKSANAGLKKATEVTNATTSVNSIIASSSDVEETTETKSVSFQALPVSADKTVKKTTKQSSLSQENKAAKKDTKKKEKTAMGTKSNTVTTSMNTAKAKKSKKTEKAVEAPAVVAVEEPAAMPVKAKKGKKAEKAVEAPAVVAVEEPAATPVKAKKGKKAEKAVEAPAVVAVEEPAATPVKAKKGKKFSGREKDSLSLNDEDSILKQIEALQKQLSQIQAAQNQIKHIEANTDDTSFDANVTVPSSPKKSKSVKKNNVKSKDAVKDIQENIEIDKTKKSTTIEKNTEKSTEIADSDTNPQKNDTDLIKPQAIAKKKKTSKKSKDKKNDDDVLAAVETTSIDDPPSNTESAVSEKNQQTKPNTPSADEQVTASVQQQKKKRGRRPKSVVAEVVKNESDDDSEEISDADLLMMMTRAKTSVSDKKNAKALAKHAALTKNDTMKQYMGEIGVIPLVSKEQEIELASQIHGEDFEAQEAARNTLIMANLRLVVKIAHDFKGLGLPLLDLISEGNLGLMRAVMKFDPEKGAKFSSYAAWWIKQSMRRALANQSKTIRIPVQSAGKINKIKSSRVKLAEELGREPTDAEIASNLDYSERTVSGLRLADLRTFSLHDPIQQGEEGEFQDIIPDRSAMTPERILGDEESKNRLKQILDELDEREQQIIRMRFGIDYNDGQGMTLEEVSQRIGRTRERVRQIQNQALAKLRNKLADEAGFNND